MEIISKRARYALHGVGYIAASPGLDAVPFDSVFAYLKAYSGRMSLSRGYVAKIFQSLSRAGLIVSVSGPRGGYRLARPPAQTRLIELLEVLDGPVLSGCCMLSVGDCPVGPHCGVGTIMRDAERSFYNFFQRETVASMVRKMSFPDPQPGTKKSATARASAGKPRRLPVKS